MESSSHKTGYREIASYTTSVEAHIVKGRLETEGIPGLVLFEHHIRAKWYLSQALQGVRLLVPAGMVETAREIIGRLNAGEYEAALIDEQGFGTLACPKCGSTETGEHAWLRKLSLAILFITSLPFPYTSHLYSCDSCRHSWLAHDQRPYSLACTALLITLLPCGFCSLYLIFIYWIAPSFK